jgi:hypothetical protein
MVPPLSDVTGTDWAGSPNSSLQPPKARSPGLAIPRAVRYSENVNDDPHIHVEVNLFRDTVARKMLASTFGLVADLPTRVRTGCGVRVSLAMTSPRPEKVTCLACREHAANWHTRAAEEAEELHRLDGMALVVQAERLRRSIEEHRTLAKRFAER